MLVNLPQVLLKCIGFEYFQREFQAAGFIWEISLKCEFVFFFSFIFISWRLITLQYCSDFCHTLT